MNLRLRTCSAGLLALALMPPAAQAQFPFSRPQSQEDPFNAAGRGMNQNPPLASPAGAAAQPNAAAAKAQSSAYLIEARKALAWGDVARAGEFLAKAKSYGTSFERHEDSPQAVEGAIAQMSRLQQMRSLTGETQGYRREYGKVLLEQADALLRWGQFDAAERLARNADSLGVQFNAFERNPGEVLTRVAQARALAGQAQTASSQGGGRGNPVQFASPGANYDQGGVIQAGGPAFGNQGGVVQAGGPQAFGNEGGVIPASGSTVSFPQQGVQQPVYNQPGGGQPAFNQPVYNQQPGQPSNIRFAQGQGPQELPAPGGNGPAAALYQQGHAALKANQVDKARQLFLQAEAQQDQLDAATRGELAAMLRYLGRAPQQNNPADAFAQEQNLIRAKVASDLAVAQRQARALQQTDPFKALEVLKAAASNASSAPLDDVTKRQMLARVEHDISLMQRYIAENEPRLRLDQNNQQVKDDIAREQQMLIESQQRLAYLVDKYNQLMDEQRWAEAEVVVKEAENLMPNEPVVVQMKQQSRLIRNLRMGEIIRDEKSQNFALTAESVDESSIAFDDRNPIQFPDNWQDLSNRRTSLGAERRRTEQEIAIQQKLKTPVAVQFENAPLSEVLQTLATVADVNLHIDTLGLQHEGVMTDHPVTLKLPNEISLKSALNLILEPLRLGYVIRDEVLKVTSSQMRHGDVYVQVYNVADLVVPIPNFVPAVDMGLTGSLKEAYRQTNFFGDAFASNHAPVAAVASQTGGTTNAALDKGMLAQLAGPGTLGGIGGGGGLGGPGGLQGGAEPDYDHIIQLITSTVAPATWQEVGGAGSIEPFEGNLSLVVSNTEEVHEQVADLLQQLRRLQDLQVTIEVRFISINDNFFERIGVDFDFDIDDDIDRPFQVFGQPNRNAAPGPAGDIHADHPRNIQDRDHGDSVTVGMSAPGVFAADLDIPVTQGSFGLAVPQFGGFQPGAGATVGFAILSDIEAFFFIEASQGDRRSNVLQAPKVTLFNGQSAIVSDTSQTPFVISVIPVVGDFAAAQQPVIVVLNEGTFLNVQAVVSNDRRFVRLTVVPFFSTIGDVNTFTFEGAETTEEETESSVGPDDETDDVERRVRSRRGTTVQLPTFSFITVTTTVSVPDGGTVLLGGIKRLSEGRNEFGVPILSKVPYVNRLFKNVGIGRETQSLMMMVTPRIIIQEEEEAILLGNQATP